MRAIATLFVLGSFFAVTAAASAQDIEGGTVNSYSDTQASAARQLATQAGYHPTGITMALAGNLFLDAQRSGQDFTLVVTPDHQLYASNGLPMNAASNVMAANSTAPAR